MLGPDFTAIRPIHGSDWSHAVCFATVRSLRLGVILIYDESSPYAEYLIVDKRAPTPIDLLVELSLYIDGERNQPGRLIHSSEPPISHHALVVFPPSNCVRRPLGCSRASAGYGESFVCGWNFARALLPFSFGAIPAIRLFEVRSMRSQDGCCVWPRSIWTRALRLPNETCARHLREQSPSEARHVRA
jgi:hypothetical protein